MALNIHETLIQNSSTAMSNLFAVTFIPENNNSTVDYSLFTYRLTGNIEFPSLTRTTVELPYKDTSIQTLIPGLKIERSFSLMFRIDTNYELYTRLLNNVYTHDGLLRDSGFADIDVDSFAISVKVLGNIEDNTSLSNFLDNLYPEQVSSERKASSAKSFTFRGCRVTDIQKITLGYEGSSGNTVTVQFIYSTLDISDFL